MGHPVSAETVRKELLKLGFSRQANRKADGKDSCFGFALGTGGWSQLLCIGPVAVNDFRDE
jgi:hypothetical protein